MGEKQQRSPTPPARRRPRVGDYEALLKEILRAAGRDLSRVEFLGDVAGTLLDFAGCDWVEVRVRKDDQCFRCEATSRPEERAAVRMTRCKQHGKNPLGDGLRRGEPIDEICRMVIERRGSSACFTKGGSFWTGNLVESLGAVLEDDPAAIERGSSGPEEHASLIVVPLTAGEPIVGLLTLGSRRKDHFQRRDVEGYEAIAATFGLTLANQLAHASLRERIKELTCLYSLAQIAEGRMQLGDILQGVVEHLPPAWQYPEATAARIVYDGCPYIAGDFEKCVDRQSADLVVKQRKRGTIEVGYTREQPELDEGPFLREERSLIDTVACQVANLIERREAAEERRRLQDQLRHADRLATIGQLSAGVAHELNEPLGNILAFAQLAEKEPDVPEQVGKDLHRIVTTSLHAREIIKKLMLFARQMPPRKMQVELNGVVEEGLSLLESRCLKEGIVIQRDLVGGLPEIVADPSQLSQVVVNLVVNAIQAMPDGGLVRIATRADAGGVVLAVEDAGVGMDREVQGEIFTPFFTTKDVHEGTGLGLAVVHGIVTSHGGAISVESAPGKGSRFEVRLPVTRDEMPGAIQS